MIFFFGTRGKVLQGPQRRGVPCAACGMDVHATYGILRHFHVFWIPVFPTLMRAGMECLHCKKALVGKEIPERIRKEVSAAVFTKRRVIPAFAGVILLAALVVLAAVGAGERSAKEAEYLAAPAAGDLYVVKLAGISKLGDAQHPYGLVRVASVAGDRVELQMGTYAYGRASGADKAIRGGDVARADYFALTPFPLSKADLQRLKRDRTIQSVRRR